MFKWSAKNAAFFPSSSIDIYVAAGWDLGDAVDIENDVLGKDKDGNDIRLKDLWPSDAEINAVEKSCVRPDSFFPCICH